MSVGMFSEMFLSEDEVPCLKALNDRVDAITAKQIQKASDAKTALDPEFIAAQRPKSFLYSGLPIYSNRCKPLVCVFVLLSAYCVLSTIPKLGGFVSVLCLALGFISYDFYSGLLHIVFDYPGFISLPLLGQGCLEFQWHHHIPNDLCKKDFLFVLGDLNMVLSFATPLHLMYNAEMMTDPLKVMLFGCRVLYAVLGQYSHNQAHQVNPKLRGPLTQHLRNWGIIATMGDHHKHHTPPHNTNFCLIGPCNKIIQAFYTCLPSPYFHLAFFMLVTIIHVNVECAIIKFFQ